MASLRDMCGRLREAAGSYQPGDAGQGSGTGSGGGFQGEGSQASKHWGAGGASTGGASGTGAGGTEEDVYTVLALLRRMLLWPVDAELLAGTGAGKEVARLKRHPNALVRGAVDACMLNGYGW